MRAILAGIKNWSEFEKLTSTLEPQKRGELFELLTKYYLLLHPTYRTELSDVWLLSEVPQSVRGEVGLPAQDKGIDIIARTRTGSYWAVQCKYRRSSRKSLTWREISTFTGLAFGVCKAIDFGLIAYSGERYTKVVDEAQHIAFLSNDVWSALDESFFAELAGELETKPVPLIVYEPRPHQLRAIKNASTYFAKPDNTRGKLIMPCGSGKSLTSFWIAQALEAKFVVVAVPSLALIQQTLPVWLREYFVRDQFANLRWLCVCSDESVAKSEADSVVLHKQDLGYPCLTDRGEIESWFRKTEGAAPRVIFTTYQSGKLLAEAMRGVGMKADLVIMDEAHRTVGDKERLFSHLLFDENLPAARRVFMTATERRFVGQSDDLASMDDEEIYGRTFELLSFKEALEQCPPILSDYKIVTMVISQEEIAKLIAENRYVRPQAPFWDQEVEAQMLASLVALRKLMQKYPVKHAVSFHNSIARAELFCAFNHAYTQSFPEDDALDTFHVTGAMRASVRKSIVAEFVRSSRSLITNARCLTEGIDVPDIDCVLFADPKQSTVDIVQAVGRCLRPSEGKELGYVLVPLISRGESGEALAESAAFAPILTILRALAANDERIIEYFRTRRSGRRLGAGIVQIEVDDKIGRTIDLEDFAAQIETKVWNRLAPLSWLPYDEAVKFVRALSLRNREQWQAYCRGERPELPSKPPDIPAGPTNKNVYGTQFLAKGGWGAWLGTGNKSRKFAQSRPWDEAIKFVHSLNLTSVAGWLAYCRGERPDLPPQPRDIPSDPRWVYGEEYIQKGRMRGWLGGGRQAGNWRPYQEAVVFVHGLKLRSGEDWRAYCNGRRPDLPPKPQDFPQDPSKVYSEEFKEKGGWAAWLGKARARPKEGWRGYDEAVKFVHGLKLKNEREWQAYVNGGRSDLPPKPEDIPKAAKLAYGDEFRKKGGWPAWLGKEKRKGSWRSYEDAVKFVHKLNLKNSAEWQTYYKGERPDLPRKPDDIPAGPYEAYGKQFVDKGGMGAWLGTGQVARHPRKKFRPYADAVKFVGSLKLKSGPEWRAYVRGKRPDLPARPHDIPVSPYAAYGGEFWDKGGWKTWLEQK